MLHGEGIETGIDLDALIGVAEWLEGVLGRQLEGQVYRAGTFAPVAALATERRSEWRTGSGWTSGERSPTSSSSSDGDGGSAQFRVKTPSTPSDPSEGVLNGVAADLRRGRDRRRRAPQHPARHDRRDERGARVEGRPRRPDHDAGLQADPAPRALADAGAARGLDHHDQARPAGLARRHARGGRADGRARRDRSSPVDDAAGRGRSSATSSSRASSR